jgi:hypothetical protein
MTSVPKITIRWRRSWHPQAFDFVAGVFHLVTGLFHLLNPAHPAAGGLIFLLAEQSTVQPIDEV